MQLNWYDTESAVMPEIVDETSSPSTVYLRKDITEVTKEDEIFYQYKEAKLTPIEYEQYLANATIEKNESDIFYIAMMSDIDLEEA